MENRISNLSSIMDNYLFRVLVFAMALVLAGCILLSPKTFAANTSPLKTWQSLLLVWAVCAGIIYGIGFKPKKLYWKVLFLPLLATPVLGLGLLYFYSH